MTCTAHALERMRVALLALSLLAVLPGWTMAQKVVIKNETPTPLIVQGSYIVQGRVQRGRPLQVQPGDSITMIHPRVKLTIAIADARLPVIIGRADILPAVEDQHFSIQADLPSNVKLEPAKPVR